LTGAPWYTIRWQDGGVSLLDQRRLPSEECYLLLTTVEDVAAAIEQMAIRGAPAIGCAAALGVALGAAKSDAADVESLVEQLESEVIPRLRRTRPTAVNLFWALDRIRAAMQALAQEPGADVDSITRGLIAAADAMVDEDRETCVAIGRHGAGLIEAGARVLTHCNAGALATGGYGTALGVIRAAAEAGRAPRVLAGETRPLLQGARLTAWELQRDGIDVKVCTDNMVAYAMQRSEVDLVVVGADRIAANGDVANKIGTYGVAVLAEAHGVPFYVAAPRSTIDRAAKSAADIPIEERDRSEIARIGETVVLPDGVDVEQYAFDLTPSRLVSGIITEKGIVRAPYGASIAAIFAGVASAGT
jgi:methylthioribose-1-phosphate isomerase